ncbi:hypothetical protein SHIRM173S_02625 [Streptomyces hirsutus]
MAGTGVLPTPSGVSGPAATATATATATGPPERPLPPHPSEKDAPGGVAPGEEQGKPSGDADGDTGRQDGPGTGADEDGGLAETGVKTGDLGAGNGRGKQIASACRALRDGRKLPGNRRRLLEGAAGGSAHVGPYCENVLAHHGTGADTGTGSGPDSGPTTKRDGGNDTGNGRSDNGNGNGNGSNEGAANGNAGDGRRGERERQQRERRATGTAGNGKRERATANKGNSRPGQRPGWPGQRRQTRQGCRRVRLTYAELTPDWRFLHVGCDVFGHRGAVLSEPTGHRLLHGAGFPVPVARAFGAGGTRSPRSRPRPSTPGVAGVRAALPVDDDLVAVAHLLVQPGDGRLVPHIDAAVRGTGIPARRSRPRSARPGRR